MNKYRIEHMDSNILGGMLVRYLSTRGDERLVSSARAITSGIAPDGGLYVPEQIPVINEEDWASLLTMSYQEQALYILGKYLSDFP